MNPLTTPQVIRRIYTRVCGGNARRNALRTSALERTRVAVRWKQPYCTDRTHFNIGLCPRNRDSPVSHTKVKNKFSTVAECRKNNGKSLKVRVFRDCCEVEEQKEENVQGTPYFHERYRLTACTNCNILPRNLDIANLREQRFPNCRQSEK